MIICYHINYTNGVIKIEYNLRLRQRNPSKDEMISDIIHVAEKLNTTTLTKKQYQSHGKFNPDTIAKKFDGWSIALESCGLIPSKTSIKPRYKNATPNKLIEDIKRVAQKLNTDTLTSTEYDFHGKYNHNSVAKAFGSWKQAIHAAGLKDTNYHRNISEAKLMENIANVWSALGRQPYCSDIKDGLSNYGIKVYFNRYGSWNNALKNFVDYIGKEADLEKEHCVEVNITPNSTPIKKTIHKTKRDISLKLRFAVFKRDNFKCCACGASPAKDSSVELHVDHIKPWSKGGETILENLQTLCSKCNLGKKDIL